MFCLYHFRAKIHSVKYKILYVPVGKQPDLWLLVKTFIVNKCGTISKVCYVLPKGKSDPSSIELTYMLWTHHQTKLPTEDWLKHHEMVL